MKQLFLLSLIGFLSLSYSPLNAQRIKDKAVNLKYIQLPKRNLPPDHKTYSVYVSGPLFSQAGSTAGVFARETKMDGFKRLDGIGNNSGHLRVSIYGGRVYTGQLSPKTRTVKKKNKEGVETTTHYYSYEVPFRCNTSFKVFDPEGNILSNGEYSNDNVLQTDEHTTTKSRSENRARDVAEVESKHAKNAITQLRNGINSGLINLYDYDKREDRMFLYLIKKHTAEDRWEKHFEEVKTIFKEASHAINSQELKEKLNPALEFYKSQGSKDPRGDKKLKRVYKAANYNLAVLHFAVDEFAEAKAHAQKVIDSEKKDRRASNLLESIEDWEKSMEKLGVNSIHYKRDLSDALPPAKIAALEAEKEEIEENSTTTAGKIYKGEQAFEGTWSLDKEADDLIFGEGGNIKFVIEEGGEMKEINPTNADITAFMVADRKFEKTRFVPSAKGATEASIEILEEVYASERIKLFKFYPSTGALSDDKPEFAFQKKGQEFPVSLESTMFLLWKKGLSDYFSDCSDLSEMAAEGGFEKTKDSLIKAARVYSELCTDVIKP